MRFKLLGATALACTLVSSATGLRGQTGARRGAARPAPDEAEVARQQQQAQSRQLSALQTLLYLKNTASEIEDAQDRVRVFIEVADALWIADQQQSREVFQRAFDNAVAYENGLDEKQRKSFGMALRRRVVARIARRDAAFANRLLNASVPKEAERPATPDDAFAKLYGQDSARGDVLVRAAAEMLATDKEAAVQLGRLAAAEGFTQGLRRFLVVLRAKDRAAADFIFEIAFQSAAGRSPKELVEALFLWDYAFQRGDIYLGPVAWLNESGGQAQPVSFEIKQRALSFAIEAVLENAQQFDMASATDEERPLVRERNVLIYSLASQIMPDVERYAPGQSQLLQTQLSRIEQDLRDQGHTPPAPPEPLPTTESASEDVEKMLNIASRVTNQKVRDGVYARAALTLYMHHEYERALEIANKIDDHALELMLTEPIKFDRAGELLAAKNPDAALTVARTLDKPEVQISVLARIGRAFFDVKKPARATEVLGEAEVLAAKTEPSQDLASALLAIAQSYMAQDRAKAADITASAIRAANASGAGEPWELLLAGTGPDGRLSAQNLNWASGRGGIVTSVSVTYPKSAGLLDVISKLSASDLDNGLMLAQQLKWKSVSLAAQAVICREALESGWKNKGVRDRGRGRAE